MYLDTFQTESGGVVVDSSTNVKMYGKVRTVFKISTDATIDKFTNLHFNLAETKDSASKGVCLYRDDGGGFSTAVNVRCVILGTSPISSLSNVITVNGDADSLGGTRMNLALGKFADSISTFNKGTAGKAVDGGTTQEFNFDDDAANTVMSTNLEFEPWWRVDLAQLYKIEEIVIYKRLDGYSGRLFNFELLITDFDGNEVFNDLFTDTNDDHVLTIVIPQVYGRFGELFYVCVQFMFVGLYG